MLCHAVMRAMCSAVRVCVNMCAYVCARACANSFPSHPSTHSCRVVCCVLRAVCCVVSCGTCCVVLCRAVLCRAVMCAMCSEICVCASVCVYVHPSTHSNIHPSRQSWVGWEGRVVCCVLCAVSCVCMCVRARVPLYSSVCPHMHTPIHPTTRPLVYASQFLSLLHPNTRHEARTPPTWPNQLCIYMCCPYAVQHLCLCVCVHVCA